MAALVTNIARRLFAPVAVAILVLSFSSSAANASFFNLLRLQMMRADLRISSFSLDRHEVRIGETLKATLDISNDGTLSATSTLLTFWAAPGPNYSLSNASRVALINLGTLQPKARLNYQSTFALPAWIQMGTLRIFATVDTSAPEPNRANNSLEATLVVVSASPPPPSQAPVFYVAPWGSDANPGTVEQPFRTLRKGASLLTPGATLVVRGGTYDEQLMNAPWRNGGVPDIPGGDSWNIPVTIRAYPGETAVLRPLSGGPGTIYFQGANSRYIVIDGLVIDGSHAGGVVITGSGDPAQAAHHIRLINCEIKNSAGDGVLMSQFSSFNEIINCRIHHNGENGFAHGLYISTSDNLVEGNRIHENSGYGVHLYGQASGKVNRNVVRNNLIYQSGWQASQFGIIVSSGHDNKVYNNVINNSHGGILVQHYGPTNTLIANNTLHNLATYSIHIGPDASNTLILNNISSAAPSITNNGRQSTIDRNLVGIDPLFANPGQGDFRLLVGSPAIDAGLPITDVRSDFYGVGRPQGASYDIGAVEYSP